MNICFLILKCVLSSIYQIWLWLECKQNIRTKLDITMIIVITLTIWSKITSNDNSRCLNGLHKQPLSLSLCVLYSWHQGCWLLSLCFISLTYPQMLVDFTGSLSSLTHESTHSLSTLYLNKVFVIINMEIVKIIIATLSLSGFCTIIVITTFMYLPNVFAAFNPSFKPLVFLVKLFTYIFQVSLSDGGNYSCQPASLHRASTTLHVLKVIFFFVFVFIFVVVYVFVV